MTALLICQGGRVTFAASTSLNIGSRSDDSLEGLTNRAAHIGFLLHPDININIDGRQAYLTRGTTRIALEFTLPIECEPAVWWPDMGHELATRRLTLTLPTATREAITTFQVLSREATA